MKKTVITILILSISLLFCSLTAPAKKIKKKNFEKLDEKNRTFFLTQVEFVYGEKEFYHDREYEINRITPHLNTKLIDAIDVEKIKSTIEAKYPVKINANAYKMRHSSRKDNPFFSSTPLKTGKDIVYRWSVPSTKNRLALTIYLFKVGKTIILNRAIIEFKFFTPTKNKKAYKLLGSYTTGRLPWKTPEDIFEVIKTNCFLK